MPDRETLRQTLIELLEADTGEKYTDLDENINLRDGLGLDSVDVVSIVSQIERRFRNDALRRLPNGFAVHQKLEVVGPGGARTRAQNSEVDLARLRR